MSEVNRPNDVSKYFEAAPCFVAFKGSEDQALEFPLTISKMAEAAQTTVHTVRNYVLENLILCPDHTSAGFGLYDQCALNRLYFIRAARDAGLMILDIKPLLYAINDGDRQTLDEAMRLLQAKIDERKTHLHSLDSQLSELRKLAKS